MYPFRRILLPTDFSTASQWAFDDAARIAAASGAEILVLHIRMTWESDPGELRFPAAPGLYEYAEQQELEKVRKQLRAAGAKSDPRLIVKTSPHPGGEICRTAKEENADLVIMATHARHHVAHLLIGSTTMAVINDPPAPVLAIRYGTKKHEGMRRIVVPVHLKQKSHAALDLAVNIARRQNSELHLLTICGDEQRAAAEALLNEVAKTIEGLNVTKQVVRGTDVEKEIVRYADRANADVIVINADQQMSEAKTNIIRNAATPVLVVPRA